MIADALHTIETKLLELAANATAEHPIDPFDVTVIARQIGAQAEMLEKGLEAV